MEDKIIDRLLVITNGAMLMNGKQIAAALGLHPTTISELKAKGLLGVPVSAGTGKRDRYSVVSVARYLLGLAEPTTTPTETTKSPQKPRKKTPSGLPTLAQIRSLALRHFQAHCEHEARKSAEAAQLLNHIIEREDLMVVANQPTKTVPEAL